MSLPCPQRDALEQIEKQTIAWPDQVARELTPGKKFRLTTGEKVHFLGISTGASLRRKINLHIAVFGFHPPEKDSSPEKREKRQLNAALLGNCQFGGLITGPDQEYWFWTEGLEIVSVKKTVVLRRNGRRAKYRPI